MNRFVVSSIVVTGIGGLTRNIGDIQITSIATALILGILTNLLVKEKQAPQVTVEIVEEVAEEVIEDAIVTEEIAEETVEEAAEEVAEEE